MFPAPPTESMIDAFLTVSQTVSAALPGLQQVAYLEARSYKYPTLHTSERGRNSSDTIRSGKAIQSPLDLVIDTDYGAYDGQEDWVFNVSEGVEFLTTHWRKEKGTQAIHEDELDAMFTGGIYDAQSVAYTLIREDRQRRRRLVVDAVESIETSFWAAAVPAMELGKATNPVRSIPYFMNEWANGLAPNCTTQHGITTPGAALGPDGRQLLVCDQREYFDSTTDATINAFGHLIEVLDEAIRDNRQELIPLAREYSVTEDVLASSYPGFFCTSRAISYLSRVYRSQKEAWGFGANQMNDPARRTFIFDGKPFYDVPSLKNAAIYAARDGAGLPDPTAALVTEENSTGDNFAGARFYLPMWSELHHYYFSGKKMEIRDWYSLDQTNPENYVMWIRNKRCFHANRLKPHVFIGPGEDISNFATR